MTRTYILTIILCAFIATQCNTGNKNSMTTKEKTELLDSLTKIYEDLGDSEARQHAKKLVAEFEKAKAKHGDSLKYFSDIFVGIDNPSADTSAEKDAAWKKTE